MKGCSGCATAGPWRSYLTLARSPTWPSPNTRWSKVISLLTRSGGRDGAGNLCCGPCFAPQQPVQVGEVYDDHHVVADDQGMVGPACGLYRHSPTDQAD